jgi:hypothetical protein
LPLPKLFGGQVEWVKRQVADYVSRQREAYRIRGTALDQHQKESMRAFFQACTLDSARVLVLSGERVANPPFYAQLVQMGFEPADLPNFALMAAITFVDTVVSHEQFTDRLLFHELVHVVQYQKFGMEGFAVRYVSGLLSGGSNEAIPLEKNAYELDARYAAAPAGAFPVEVEVQKWIDRGMF